MSFVEAFLGELFWEVSNFDADTAICIHIYVYIGLLRTYPWSLQYDKWAQNPGWLGYI